VAEPAADVEVTVELVRDLLRAQHSDLAERELRPLAHGWDNELVRIGDDLVARLPRRLEAAPLVQRELRWMPQVERHCSLPVPVPLRRGEPDDRYPYVWSIVPYLRGEPVGDAWLDGGAAMVLGEFARRLHVAAPLNAPVNPVRGVPLAMRTERLELSLATLGDRVDGARIREVWAECLAAPVLHGPPMWIHGDLHPFNVLWDDGEITAVIDFGDLAGGDPATDLALGYEAFQPRERAAFFTASGADEATLVRARGWALSIGTSVLASGDPALAVIGARTVEAALRNH